MSLWMTDAELAAIRADIEELMPDSCTIQRATVTNTGGNVSESWADVETAICRVDPFNLKDAGTDVTEMLDREAILSTYRITLPYDANIQEGDRLIFGGQVFNLIQLSDVHSDRACRRLVASRIQGEASA